MAGKRTSFRVTGFSSRDRWVRWESWRSGSRSASSEMLFAVSTRVLMPGVEVASVGWM